IGTITMDKLTLAAGSQLDFELGASNTSDLINVTAASGLTLNGGGFNLGGTVANGTYPVFDYNTAFPGSLSNLPVLGPSGFAYSFTNDTVNSQIDLVVATATGTTNVWNADSNGNWSDASKWGQGVIPTGVDAAPTFGGIITANRTVSVDSVRTVGSI